LDSDNDTEHIIPQSCWCGKFMSCLWMDIQILAWNRQHQTYLNNY